MITSSTTSTTTTTTTYRLIRTAAIKVLMQKQPYSSDERNNQSINQSNTLNNYLEVTWDGIIKISQYVL